MEMRSGVRAPLKQRMFQAGWLDASYCGHATCRFSEGEIA
jgi:hypothetical protein